MGGAYELLGNFKEDINDNEKINLGEFQTFARTRWMQEKQEVMSDRLDEFAWTDDRTNTGGQVPRITKSNKWLEIVKILESSCKS